MATNLENLKTYLSISDASEDGLLSLLLNSADKKILNKRYPFGYTDEEAVIALEKYSDIELDIAVYLYNRKGSEGQTGHSEIGIGRSYESAGIPDSYVRDIVPICKVF
jgi:hypothetical protein